MTRIRLNFLVFILIGILGFLQYHLWFESGGIHDMMQLKKKLALQKEQNQQLKKINEDLSFQIQRLQNSKDASESRARNELGMIKKGETFYQVVK